jgi:hypothetical protein
MWLFEGSGARQACRRRRLTLAPPPFNTCGNMRVTLTVFTPEPSLTAFRSGWDVTQCILDHRTCVAEQGGAL